MDLDVLCKALWKSTKEAALFLYVLFILMALVGIFFGIISLIFYGIIQAGIFLGFTSAGIELFMTKLGFGVIGCAAIWAFVIDPIRVNYNKIKRRKELK